ncbi:pathogenesis-related homeodomain protein isoform X2 [Brassica rapa]|uniref:pathogenesis-related homeodomain protein isoform X2 n=1 Tax=Brassica campestris TaxID=3711 RepID=UPI00142E48AE|nr:pathogenesis-related homeodomain protein isoform X2 [Brassica rapa]
MKKSVTKGRIEKETDKACVSVEKAESTLLSSLVKKGKQTSNKRKYTKRKSEEEISSKSNKRKYSRCNEEEEEEKGKKTRKRKRKRQQKGNKVEEEEVDEALRLQRRTRYLLIKMKMQQNLIDAYAAEGWKGQSREKIRPDKELERARKHIFDCKLGLRDAIHQLDLLSSVGRMEEKVMAPDGSIHHDHIFCAECNSREAFPDNDIILCDGTCNRAFHQKCLDPPLETESIPPGDQGWFCKFCDCKIEIIDAMNAQIGTQFSVDSNWQDIFNEEASLPVGCEATLNKEADWPSDDSEDGDYDPETKDKSSSKSDSGGGGGDNDGESVSSSSVSLASDGVALSTGSWEGGNMVDSEETSNEETVCGPRQRKTVDYTKLYHEMFGKDAVLQEQGSEDEDWGPSDRRKRKKESDGASTLVAVCENSKKDQDVKETPEQTQHSERDSVSVEGKVGKRPMFRIPRAAVEKLRQVFVENELPSKAVRDSLSKELSLDPEKVSKWFKNARYMALRNRKTESMKQPEGSKAGSGDSGREAVLVEKNTERNETQGSVDETTKDKNTGANENHETLDQTVTEENTVTNEVQDTLDEPVMEENSGTNEFQDTLDGTVMEENTEAPKIQDTLVETFMEKNSETNEIQDPTDETVMEYTETKEVQDTVDVENNSETNEMQGTMEINEIHDDTMDETVPLRYDDFTDQTTVSACNDKQEETEDANDSFPTPPEDESQQYLEQKDSSFALVPHEELTSEMSVETPIEDKEAESQLKEEEELEALMEVLCRAENKLMDVTHRLERFRTPKGRKKLSKSSSCLSEEDYVVYVPTAEIKVKR